MAHKALLVGWKLNLLGTDISTAALNAARTGSYDARALRLVDPADRALHFDHDPVRGRWTLKAEVRALATWKCHNLLQPLATAEEPFDCIFLKNVLIYFDAESKQTRCPAPPERPRAGGLPGGRPHGGGV